MTLNVADTLGGTTPLEPTPLTLRLPPTRGLSDEALLELAAYNRELRLERTARGDLIIMPPAGGNSGRRNANLTLQLARWQEQNGTGEVFDSSTGFRLPNSAIRSPDTSWINEAQLAALPAEAWEKCLPLCPAFVIELRSSTDSLRVLKRKMQEYRENGTELGWLIDPQTRRVTVYTPSETQDLENPETLSGEPVLAGFVLDLRRVWN